MNLAQINNPVVGEHLQGKTGVTFFQRVIPSLVSLALVVGFIIFFFNLISGAIGWISSSGDKAKLETARGRISSALVGVVILISSFALIRFIERFFDIPILTLDIGKLIIK